MGFEGFSEGTLAFLGDLAENNDREWFSANKARYEAEVLEREKTFVAAMAGGLAALEGASGGPIHAEPRVGGSIFRINRDIRFSRDKSPFKTHADMWFWVGDDRKTAAGYFVRIVAHGVWIGGGVHMLTPEQLTRMRRAIADEPSGSEIGEIVVGLRDSGYYVGDEAYKRVPRGFPADHPRAELLRFGYLHAMKQDLPVPPEFYSSEFLGWCGTQFADFAPLVRWLVDVL
jgi:uncharacterized protein (TIGR02453 family)